MVAARRARFFLIALHGKRAHRDDRYPVDSRICPYSPRRLIAIDDRHLDVHEKEIGVLGFGDSHAGRPILGLDDRSVRAGKRAAKKVTQHATLFCLILYNEDALAHGSLF